MARSKKSDIPLTPQCQAALALRNLASDEKYQIEIVRSNGLPPLLRLLRSSFLPLILSAAACVRNVSIHPQNESPIIDAGFLHPGEEPGLGVELDEEMAAGFEYTQAYLPVNRLVDGTVHDW